MHFPLTPKTWQITLCVPFGHAHTHQANFVGKMSTNSQPSIFFKNKNPGMSLVELMASPEDMTCDWSGRYKSVEVARNEHKETSKGGDKDDGYGEGKSKG